jgi:hypothetical protein
MSVPENVDIIIAYNPHDPSEQGKIRSVPADEAYALVTEGRARWPDPSPAAEH